MTKWTRRAEVGRLISEVVSGIHTYIKRALPGSGKNQKAQTKLRVRGSRNSSDNGGAQLRGRMTSLVQSKQGKSMIISIDIACIHLSMSTHVHESEQSEQIHREREREQY